MKKIKFLVEEFSALRKITAGLHLGPVLAQILHSLYTQVVLPHLELILLCSRTVRVFT
jgi:hypothetical protein